MRTDLQRYQRVKDKRSICKKIDIVDIYFSNEENLQLKVYIMKLAKDGIELC